MHRQQNNKSFRQMKNLSIAIIIHQILAVLIIPNIGTHYTHYMIIHSIGLWLITYG